MKKHILLVAMLALPLTILVSCEEPDLINGGAKTTTTPTTGTTTPNTTPTTGTTPTTTTPTTAKCYIKDIVEVADGETYKSTYAFNAKNLLEKVDADGAITTYSYDANSRITMVTIVDGTAVETFTYAYDAKGNITNVKYTAKNTPFEIFIKEYIFTSNAAGQVTKVVAVTKDGNLEFTLEYDAKSNVKKILVLTGAKKETLFENLTFDDKMNAYANTGLSKANIPFLLLGAFFGENLSYFINTNNVLTDSRNSAFSNDPITSVYTYTYTKEGQPAKMSYIETEGKNKTTGNSTFTYTCK